MKEDLKKKKIPILKASSYSLVGVDLLSFVTLGAGFRVAQLVLICLPPSHCPPICCMAFSAS